MRRYQQNNTTSASSDEYETIRSILTKYYCLGGTREFTVDGESSFFTPAIAEALFDNLNIRTLDYYNSICTEASKYANWYYSDDCFITNLNDIVKNTWYDNHRYRFYDYSASPSLLYEIRNGTVITQEQNIKSISAKIFYNYVIYKSDDTSILNTSIPNVLPYIPFLYNGNKACYPAYTYEEMDEVCKHFREKLAAIDAYPKIGGLKIYRNMNTYCGMGGSAGTFHRYPNVNNTQHINEHLGSRDVMPMTISPFASSVTIPNSYYNSVTQTLTQEYNTAGEIIPINKYVIYDQETLMVAALKDENTGKISYIFINYIMYV